MNGTFRSVWPGLLPLLLAGLLLMPDGSAGAAPRRTSLRRTAQTNSLDASEQEVVAELSLARTKPAEYAAFLEKYRRQFRSDRTVEVDGKMIQTKEGPPAVDEAIAFLKKAKPLSELSASPPLALAARDHVNDIGPKGVVGHDGSDGSKPADRVKRHGQFKTTCGENIAFGHDKARSIVMQLIIDDGVPDRGHRKNIFNPDFKVVGVAIGPHKGYRHMCTMDFADEVKAKDK